MTIRFNGYTIDDLLRVEDKLSKLEAYAEWLFRMSSQINPVGYQRAFEELLRRFPEFSKITDTKPSNKGDQHGGHNCRPGSV